MGEKCDACNGRLEEDFMSDYLTMSVDQRPCSKCQGTGVIERTGPYRLADGTWSDGVDRSELTRSWDWGKSNPSRLSVICAESDTDTYEGFFVYRGNEHLFDEPDELFPTHAEAIAYADRMARTNQGEER